MPSPRYLALTRHRREFEDVISYGLIAGLAICPFWLGSNRLGAWRPKCDSVPEPCDCFASSPDSPDSPSNNWSWHCRGEDMAPNELVHSEPVALRILEHGTVPLLREAERTVDGVVVDVGSYRCDCIRLFNACIRFGTRSRSFRPRSGFHATFRGPRSSNASPSQVA
jgi:hypothetical protein